jgi:hypothetical protein
MGQPTTAPAAIKVALEVTERYSVAGLRAQGSEMLAGLPAEAPHALDGRVTSCATSATRRA